MHRCYCEQPISMDSTVCLQGPEAHHLLHVLRAKQGMLVTVFDGSGAEFLAEVENTDRRNVVLRIVERRDVDCELSFDVTVGCALPKGERQKFLVEKLVCAPAPFQSPATGFGSKLAARPYLSPSRARR